MYFNPLLSVNKTLFFAIFRVQLPVTWLHWLLDSVITVHILESCEHNLGDHKHNMFVHYKTMTNCWVTQIFLNLTQTCKLKRNLTVARIQYWPKQPPENMT
jgi:hypothetical protein